MGLDRNAAYVVEVVRELEPEYDLATHFLKPLNPVITITNPDSDDVNGTVTYGWELVALLPIVPPPPMPDWPGFLAALLQSSSFAAAQIQARQVIDTELPTATGVRLERLLVAWTSLNVLSGVLLKAESGDSSLFVGAWLKLRQAQLVSPDIATAMTELATAYNLPEDLIRSLGAPDQQRHSIRNDKHATNNATAPVNLAGNKTASAA